MKLVAACVAIACVAMALTVNGAALLLRVPTPPYTLPPEPGAGDLLQAFGPVAVHQGDGVCFDYGDGKTWVARVCYPTASAPHPVGRPATP